MALILSILAHQMQNFLRQGGVQPPNHILIHKNRLKQRPKLNIFSRKLQNFLRQGAWKPQNHTYKLRLELSIFSAQKWNVKFS